MPPTAEEAERRVQPPMLTNQQLAAAMRHPTRVHAVTILNERVASASEIGRELDLPARHVSYHLQQLARYGVIELVKEVDTNGGATKSKYYRALARSWLDPASWQQIESRHQLGITADILGACNSDLATAVHFGTVHRPDNHVSRIPLLVDRTGYRCLVDRLDTLLPEVIEVQQRSAARMTRHDEAILAKVHIIQFPTPEVRAQAMISAAPVTAEPPELTDDAVLSALEHPIRVHALTVLNERIASAAEIGRELGTPSHNVTYHLKRLHQLGLIELVDVAETPGGRRKGTYYRALIRPWFDGDGWAQVDPKRQAAITSAILSLCNSDISEAVSHGTINEPDSHISRTPMILDREGYGELAHLLDQIVTEALSIQERAARRLREGAGGIATRLHLFLFESPDPSSD